MATGGRSSRTKGFIHMNAVQQAVYVIWPPAAPRLSATAPSLSSQRVTRSVSQQPQVPTATTTPISVRTMADTSPSPALQLDDTEDEVTIQLGASAAREERRRKEAEAIFMKEAGDEGGAQMSDAASTRKKKAEGFASAAGPTIIQQTDAPKTPGSAGPEQSTSAATSQLPALEPGCASDVWNVSESPRMVGDRSADTRTTSPSKHRAPESFYDKEDGPSSQPPKADKTHNSKTGEPTVKGLLTSFSKLSVNDASFTPKPFRGGCRDAGAAEKLLRYFDNYTAFRSITGEAKKQLFCLLMADTEADWLRALPETVTCNLENIITEFRKRHALTQVDVLARTVGLRERAQGP